MCSLSGPGQCDPCLSKTLEHARFGLDKVKKRSMYSVQSGACRIQSVHSSMNPQTFAPQVYRVVAAQHVTHPTQKCENGPGSVMSARSMQLEPRAIARGLQVFTPGGYGVHLEGRH